MIRQPVRGPINSGIVDLIAPIGSSVQVNIVENRTWQLSKLLPESRARDGSDNFNIAGIAQLGEPATAEALLRPGERHVRMTWPAF